MGLISNALRRAELSTSNTSLNWLWGDEGIGRSTSAGMRVTSDNAMQVAAVMACVKVLSETLAIMPLKIYRKRPGGGRVEADNLSLFEILGKSPNQFMTSFEWVELIMNHLTTRGNHYSLKVPGEYGSVSQLMPLHPDKVTMKQDRKTKEYYYDVIGDDGRPRPYTLDEILHIRGMTSGDGMVGLNPISYMRETIGLDMGASDYGSSFFGNAGIPKVALETDQPLNLNDRNELQQMWDAKYSGRGNHNKTAVCSHNLKVKVLSINPEDSQFLETRKSTRRDIASIYRVPLHLIGDLERSTNNNIEHQSLEFLMYTMMPWVRRIETCLDSSLLTQYGSRYFCKFNVEGLLRGDRKSRSEWYKSLHSIGAYSVNDVCALEDMDPIPEKEGGNKRFVNAALVELSLAGDPSIGKANVPGSPSPDTRPVDQQNSEAKPKVRLMVLAEIQKLLRWEVTETNKTANNPKEFTAKLESFHLDHQKRFIERLKPLCELLDLMGEKCIEKLEPSVKSHFESSFQMALDASECPADKLAESVLNTTAKWDSRSLSLVESLGI